MLRAQTGSSGVNSLVAAGSTGAAIVSAQVLTGLLFALLARRLDPTDFGVFATVYATSLAVGGLIDFGSSKLWMRGLSRGERTGQFNSWIIRRSLVQAVPAAIGALVALRVAGDRIGTVAAIALAAEVLFYPLSQGLASAVSALQSPVRSAWFVTIGNLLPLIAVVAAPTGSVSTATACAVSLSWILTSAVCFWSVSSRLPVQRRLEARNPWQGTLAFGVAGLGTAAMGFHLVLISVVAGPTAAALVAAVSKWVQPVYLLPTAFTLAVFPSMSRSSSDIEALRLLKPFRMLGLGGLCFVGALVTFADPMVSLVLGPEFSEAAGVLQLYALSAIPVLVAQPLSSLLQARGRERLVARNTLGAGLAGLLLVAVLAEVVGAPAGALAGIATGTFLAVVFARASLAMFSTRHPVFRTRA